MCLWPQKMKFWISCKTVFIKIPKKILLRDEIDRKIRTLNSRFFSKILGVTEKSSSLNSVENLLPEDDNFFAQCPKMIKKKENFVSKNCFLPKCVYRHKESSFENFAGKLSTTGRVYFAQCPENTKKNLIWRMPQKVFTDTWQAFRRARWENYKKGWSFSTQNTHKKPLQMKHCYSKASYGHLDCSFDNPARNLLREC